ncbi:MAG: hypothetical protein ABFS56_31800 [Pseudomonadota bacterium]
MFHHSVSTQADCNWKWDTEESHLLDLDEHGWVKSLPAPEEPPLYSIAGTVLDVPSSFPSGRYIVLYDGEGTIRYNLGAQKIDDESTPGRDVLNIDISRGLIHCDARAIHQSLQIQIHDEDTDNDSMPDDWERHFGLDPNNAADASSDPDGDGKTNLQEYQQGTHPQIPDSTTAVLGTNLNGVTDWSSQLPFTDLFKMSRSWITQCHYWTNTPDPDCTQENSWDTNEAHLLDLDQQGCEGTLEYRLGAQHIPEESVPGRDIIGIMVLMQSPLPRILEVILETEQ